MVGLVRNGGTQSETVGTSEMEKQRGKWSIERKGGHSQREGAEMAQTDLLVFPNASILGTFPG